MTITSVQIPPHSWGQWLQQSVWWCAPSGYSWRWFCWTQQWRRCLDLPLQGIQCTTTLFELSCFRNPRNHFLYCHFLSVVTTGGKTPQYLRPVRDQLFVLVPNQTTHNPRNHFLLYWLSCSDTFLLVAAFLIFPSISDLCWWTVLSTITNLWEINFFSWCQTNPSQIDLLSAKWTGLVRGYPCLAISAAEVFSPIGKPGMKEEKW